MSENNQLKKQFFFPGCSLVSSAKENYYSIYLVTKYLGIQLVELQDWNCCGTSSAHSINSQLALDLALRNIYLAREAGTLLVACPTCFIRLKLAHTLIKSDPKNINKFENYYGARFPKDLDIVPILEFLKRHSDKIKKVVDLNGLKFAPYYGCMLNLPPSIKREMTFSKVMESLLKKLGGNAVLWGYKSVCCGTFLSVVKPETVTPVVNKIFLSAMEAGAECIVTACSMCHLNLEIRCNLSNKIPVFHFSELLALAIGESSHISWFKRHIINPLPLLKKKNLL